MAFTVPTAFQPIGVFGSAEISAEKVLGADEWLTVVQNDAYIRASVNRRRPLSYGRIGNPLEIEQWSNSLARWYEIGRMRHKLSPGRTGAHFDVDVYGAEIRVSHVSTSYVTTLVEIVAGGVDYEVDDVVGILGGVGTSTATCTVTSISGAGAITGATLTSQGIYTALPRSCVVGHGPETIMDGGSGHSGGDTLTATSGTGSAATFLVDTVSAGRVTAFSAHTPGWYFSASYAVPSLPTETTGTTSDGSGVGCQLKLDFGDTQEAHCKCYDGSGTGAILSVNSLIVPSQTVLADPTRTEETLDWVDLPETEYDVIIEARNTLAPGAMALYAFRYREASILLADL